MTGGLWDDQDADPGDGDTRRLDELDHAVRELTDTLDSVLAAASANPRTTPRPYLGRPSTRRRRRSLAGGAQPTGAPWWNRIALPPEASADLDRQVREFGDWVLATYKIRHLPDRWASDPALAAEVLALYAAWRGAYHRPEAAHHEPSQWHDTLARFITRTDHYMTRLRQADAGTPPPAS